MLYGVSSENYWQRKDKAEKNIMGSDSLPGISSGSDMIESTIKFDT
jgi:hypothetical protein